MRKSIFLCFVFFVFLTNNACDVDRLKYWLPFGEKKEQKKVSEKKEKRPLAVKKSPTTIQTPRNPVARNEVPKKVFSPVSTRDPLVPLIPGQHFGGAVTSLHPGPLGIFVGSLRRLSYFDGNLSPLGSVTLEAPVVEVYPFQEAQGEMVFVKQAENILEIISWPKDGAPKILKSFKVDGNFDVFAFNSSYYLSVYLPEKIQILDATNREDIHIVSEIPQPQVTQAYPLGDFFYLVRGSAMDVIDRKNSSLLSTVQIGASFAVLGDRLIGNSRFLVLALKSPQTGKWKSLQMVSLVPGGGGISDLGVGFDLAGEADALIMEPDQVFLYVLRMGRLAFLDLETKKEIPSENLAATPLFFVRGLGAAAYFATHNYLAKAEISGAEAVSVQNLKKVSLAGSIKNIVLTATGGMVAANASLTGDDENSPLYVTTMGGAEDNPADLAPVKLSQGDLGEIGLMKLNSAGIFFHSLKNGKLYLLNPDLSGVEELAVPAGLVRGVDLASVNGTNLLFVSGTDLKGGSPALKAYEYGSPKTIKLSASLSLASVGSFQLYGGGTKALVACGADGGCLVETAADGKSLRILAKIPPSRQGVKTTEAAVSPDEKTGFLFNEQTEGNSVTLVDLTKSPPVPAAQIQGIAMQATQFRSMTFADGGQKLILPQDTGVAVYDISFVSLPRLLFKWETGKAYAADVANQGRLLCVALGEKGIECASPSTN